MTRNELSSVGTKFFALRGWLSIPTGLLFIGAGIANMQTGDGYKIWFPMSIAVAVIGYFFVNRYYVSNFGKIVPSRETKLKTGVFTLLAAVAVIVGIGIDSTLDLPISVYGASFAAALLIYYQWAVGLKLYHWLTWGGLFVVSVLPIWGGLEDTVPWTLIAMGIASIVTGVLDHRQLMAAIGRARSAGMVGDVHVPS